MIDLLSALSERSTWYHRQRADIGGVRRDPVDAAGERGRDRESHRVSDSRRVRDTFVTAREAKRPDARRRSPTRLPLRAAATTVTAYGYYGEVRIR